MSQFDLTNMIDHSAPASESSLPPGHIILAHLKQMNESGQPVVSFLLFGKSHNVQALTTATLSAADVGRQVAVSFLNGDISQPLVLGVIHSPLYEFLDQVEVSAQVQEKHPPLEAQQNSEMPLKVDGKNVVIEGKEQVELRCGEASITLTKSGRVLIRGKYLLNRASGVNRIVGGSVQVN